MRNIVQKISTLRTAEAVGTIRLSPSTLEALRTGDLPKGDPLPVARIAAIQAAKDTPRIIPFCHGIPLEAADVEFTIGADCIVVTSRVRAIYKTGVEMEALAAVSVAALTIYDMLKAIDDDMSIEGIRLTEKRGGKSDFQLGEERYRGSVVVVSDSVAAGIAEDSSGKILLDKLSQFNIDSQFKVIPDDASIITEHVKAAAGSFELIVLTGGTGVGPRDNTPEAVLPLLDKRLTGVESAIFQFGQQRTPYAMLSRTLAGTRGSTVILCLPGSPTGVADALQAVFPALLHVFQVLKGSRHD